MRTLEHPIGIGGLTAALLALTLTSACSSAYRGAAEVDPADVPRGRLVRTFARTECTGNHSNTPVVFVDYVQGADGKPFIVERNRTEQWLLMTNSRLAGDVIVFQAVRKTDAPEFREYRFPGRGSQPGTYYWSSQYEPPRGSTHRFETRPKGTPASCKLIPVDPLTGAPLATYGNTPAPSASATGWGFDGASFEPGDRVLVDVGGRSVPAEVVQAPGDAYFIRFEGGDEGGRWIDPSRITGRLD